MRRSLELWLSITRKITARIRYADDLPISLSAATGAHGSRPACSCCMNWSGSAAASEVSQAGSNPFKSSSHSGELGRGPCNGFGIPCPPLTGDRVRRGRSTSVRAHHRLNAPTSSSRPRPDDPARQSCHSSSSSLQTRNQQHPDATSAAVASRRISSSHRLQAQQ